MSKSKGKKKMTNESDDDKEQRMRDEDANSLAKSYFDVPGKDPVSGMLRSVDNVMPLDKPDLDQAYLDGEVVKHWQPDGSYIYGDQQIVDEDAAALDQAYAEGKITKSPDGDYVYGKQQLFDDDDNLPTPADVAAANEGMFGRQEFTIANLTNLPVPEMPSYDRFEKELANQQASDEVVTGLRALWQQPNNGIMAVKTEDNQVYLLDLINKSIYTSGRIYSAPRSAMTKVQAVEFPYGPLGEILWIALVRVGALTLDELRMDDSRRDEFLSLAQRAFSQHLKELLNGSPRP